MLISSLHWSPFTSGWYWLITLIMWAALSHHILSVQFYALQFAKRTKDTDLQSNLLHAIRLAAQRNGIMYPKGVHPIAALVLGFAFGFLAFVSIVQGILWLQGVLFLVAPLTVVGGLRLRLIQSISGDNSDFEKVYRKIFWHRLGVLTFGAFVLFFQAFWGVVLQVL